MTFLSKPLFPVKVSLLCAALSTCIVEHGCPPNSGWNLVDNQEKEIGGDDASVLIGGSASYREKTEPVEGDNGMSDDEDSDVTYPPASQLSKSKHHLRRVH